MAATHSEISATDKYKKLLAAAIVVLAVGLFYYFIDASLLLRVLGMVAAVLLATGLFLTTEQGNEVSIFLKQSRIELRKMIWPTKSETSQTTMIVFVAIIIVALFLWAIDLLLRWFMQMVIQ